jgi:hypothetical protein
MVEFSDERTVKKPQYERRGIMLVILRSAGLTDHQRRLLVPESGLLYIRCGGTEPLVLCSILHNTCNSSGSLIVPLICGPAPSTVMTMLDRVVALRSLSFRSTATASRPSTRRPHP